MRGDAEGEEREKAKVEKDACCGDLLARIQGIERLQDDASELVYRLGCYGRQR